MAATPPPRRAKFFVPCQRKRASTQILVFTDASLIATSPLTEEDQVITEGG